MEGKATTFLPRTVVSGEHAELMLIVTEVDRMEQVINELLQKIQKEVGVLTLREVLYEFESGDLDCWIG